MGFVSDLIFGEGPSVSQSNPADKIMPESKQERNQRNWINDYYFGASPGTGSAATASANNQAIYREMSQIPGRYGALQRGEINPAFQTNFENSIRGGVQNTIGGQLDNLSKRGVINSSVLEDFNNDLSGKVATASAGNFNQNISTISDLLNKVFGQQGNLYGLNQEQIDNATNFYNTAANRRYSLQGDTVVDPGSPGLLSSFVGGIGSGIGSGIGATM